MFLKSLTVRGFKSFADRTELALEPGVTVIVGPNGAGKSNVVDALAWVLGSHSPKSLRGGAMADVIFSGGPGRPGLGRASVEITIDNSAGTLPVEFSEVVISRAMFADGASSYAVNGEECRLLDVQELLSDTGLGRQHHTIVGQGRIDAILGARPEERRALIEEAAGILKHRQRKDRSLRKLAQMDAHVERLQDVLRELRRGLRPLERQAEAAARHAELQESLRTVRTTRAACELAGLTGRWEADQTADAGARSRLAELSAALEQARADEERGQRSVEAIAPDSRAAADVHLRLAGLVERSRGLCDRLDDRRRDLREALAGDTGDEDTGRLRARARAGRNSLAGLARDNADARTALEEAQRRRAAAEGAVEEHERAVAAAARRRDRAERDRLRWEGQVAAVRSRLIQAEGEERRLTAQLQRVRDRTGELRAQARAAEAEVGDLTAGEAQAAADAADTDGSLREARERSAAAAERERQLERQRDALEARAEALRAASRELSGGAAALAAAAEHGSVQGLEGPLVDHIRVDERLAAAVAAAFGELGDALVARSHDAARAAVRYADRQAGGRVRLLTADDGDVGAPPGGPGGTPSDAGGPPSVRAVADCLRASPGLRATLQRALADVYVVDGGEPSASEQPDADFAAACELAGRYPQCVFVTPTGQVAGRHGYAGGAGSAGPLAVRVAAERAAAEAEALSGRLQHAHGYRAAADQRLEQARARREAAQAAAQERRGLAAAARERDERLRRDLSGSERELSALARQRDDLAADVGAQRDRLRALEAQPVAAPDTADAERAAQARETARLGAALAQARETEVQARLSLGAGRQRQEEAERAVAALEQQADASAARMAARERRRAAQLRSLDRCEQLRELATAALRRAERSLSTAAAGRERLEADAAARQRELRAARAVVREREEQLLGVRDERHRADLARQQLRHALEAVRVRLRDELGADPDAALAEARSAASGEVDDQRLASDEERLARKVALLGTVNPLALEELRELAERERFLSEQLEDVRASRRDLQRVVASVDERIREVFGAAFADVSAQFERIFSRLFPGGEGRLLLTSADDLLGSGVEVEARPPGKRVKRLSLLSGGERSLTALALLFAIFAARPSPFYVLDEVEAALDDVNLQRFLRVVHDFRERSQLLIVTHQRRTMEVADCLYGVSMGAGGVSKVVSQRLPEPAGAVAAAR